MRVPCPPPAKVRSALLVLSFAWLSATYAFQVRQGRSRFDSRAIPDPSVVVSASSLATEAAQVPETIRNEWKAFRATYGDKWDVYVDARSGAPMLVQGQGIPFIPGSGNTLSSAAPVS